MAPLGGLFAPKPAPKPKRVRTRLSPADQEKALQVKFLRELARTSPDAYAAYMWRHLGEAPEKPKSDLQTTLETLAALKAAGIDIGGGGNAGLGQQLLTGLVGGLPQLGQMLQGALQPPATFAALQPPASQPSPAPQAPAPPATPPAAPDPAPHPPYPYAEVPAGVEVSLVSRGLIGQLRRKTPEEAAQWLLTTQSPELVQALVGAADAQLPALIDQTVAQLPALAGFGAWLKANPQWLGATVAALRGLVARLQVAANG